MQFAGQRTDMDLQPLGEPHNILLKFPADVLPDPGAVLITGITPQQTLTDGVTEAEFLRLFTNEVATPNTIMVGFNTVRFDDEFMRYLHYRNFYDPYEWQWQDGRSKWDLLDLVRMTRALRPGGIKWPFDVKANPTNRLELLTVLNGLDHAQAHDALNDVQASIALARLLKQKQPKLFEFLLRVRDKKAVAKLALAKDPFVYTSGKYSGEFEKTTVVATIMEHPSQQAALVFDLRYDPKPFEALSPAELAAAWRRPKDDPGVRLPIKTLKFNRCPAIAPLSVLDAASQQRLKLDMKAVQVNLQTLRGMKQWTKALTEALEILDEKQQTQLVENEQTVDERLYEGFFDATDKAAMRVVRAADPAELNQLGLDFRDLRLTALLPLYKARNFPRVLDNSERKAWEEYRAHKLLDGGETSRLARYFAQITEMVQNPNLTDHQRYLLEELQLYGQSILPESGE